MRQTNKWQVTGVEVSEPGIRYARECLGLDVFHGPLEDARFPEHHFDAVVMWDVLEHVHRPKDTLRETHRVLKPDGVLVFRIPLLDSWDHKLFGPYWAGWDAPRHLTLFSRHTLNLMLTSAGFRVARIACSSGGYTAFALSLRFWAGEHLSATAQRRLYRVLETLPLRIAAAPYFYLVGRLGKNTFTTVVALPEGGSNMPVRMEDMKP
jgi:SAM-dependent methyltransferase